MAPPPPGPQRDEWGQAHSMGSERKSRVQRDSQGSCKDAQVLCPQGRCHSPMGPETLTPTTLTRGYVWGHQGLSHGGSCMGGANLGCSQVTSAGRILH